jgi:acyl-CoA thioesterase I
MSVDAHAAPEMVDGRDHARFFRHRAPRRSSGSIQMQQARRHFLGCGLAAAGLLATGCGRAPIKGRPVASGSKVLALGDSLTHGTGAGADQAYPTVLARLTGWELINAGIPGQTSSQALERLPALLQEHQPALVLVSIGGNDLLRRMPEQDLLDNLRRITDIVRGAGAQVLLVAVPRPTLASRLTDSLDDHPLYGRLSEEMRVPLHRRGWSDVLQDPALRADAIHANAQGYEQFAQGLLATLRATGLLV